MLRSDALNSHVYPIITYMTARKQIPILYVCCTEKIELKKFLVDETLSQICSTDEDESKGISVDECYTEEEESECVNQKKKRMRQSMRNLQL